MEQAIELRFYDNEEVNWTNDMSIFGDQVQFIHVDEYEPNILISNVEAPELGTNAGPGERMSIIRERNKIYINAYIDYWAEKGNTYALYLKNCVETDSKASEEVLKQIAWENVLRTGYPNNGLNIDELVQWSQTTNNNTNTNTNTRKAVLSDWDRTLTVCEGMHFGKGPDSLPEKLKSGEITLNDLLVYIMGGQERLENIKQMFQTLNDYKVPIFILTHNHNAAENKYPEHRKVYLDMLASLIPFRIRQELDAILFSSADYTTMKSIKQGDQENSYRKYKSACSINLIKDVLKQCNQMKNGGKLNKRKHTNKRRRYTNRRRKTNRRRRRRGQH